MAMASTPSFVLTTARTTAQRLGLADFWRWWSSELRSVFAPFAARWLNNEDDITEVVYDGKSLAFAFASVAKAQTKIKTDVNISTSRIEMTAADAGMRSPDELKRAIQAALSGRTKDIRLLIAPAIALQKMVSYPAATLENLHDVMAFDMDRQTPFTASQVYFDARRAAGMVSNKNSEGASMVSVELLAVPRPALHSALHILRDAGVRVLSLGVVNDTGSPRFDLLPFTEKPARRLTRSQIINLVLISLVALLALVAIVVPIWQKRERAIALQPVVQKAQIEGEVTRKVEAEFTRLLQEYNFATAKKYATQPALEVVEELTRLSPDTTWLMNLEMKTLTNKSGPPVHEVQLTGEAESASKMIALLEQSRLLQNASQRAQTVRGSQPSLERFQIATELKPRSLPPLMAIALENGNGAAGPGGASTAMPAAVSSTASPSLSSPAALPRALPAALEPVPVYVPAHSSSPLNLTSPAAAQAPTPGSAKAAIDAKAL